MPAVRRCVWAGEHSEDACARDAKAAQRQDHACPQCDAAFGEAGSLRRHVRTVHKQREEEEEEELLLFLRTTTS